MKDLVKIGLYRLYKNWFYLLGCVLAVLITYWFLTVRPIPQLARQTAEGVAVFISAAIIAFFSIFIGFFMGNETEDGVLRNKVMAGHTQLEVYFGHYITFLIALVGMMVCWLVGAIAGGTRITLSMIVYFIVAFLYNAAYIAIIQAIVFRMKKQLTGILFSLGIFYALVTSVLMGNFIYMISAEQPIVSKVVAVFYNMSAVGQCLARTPFADPGLGETIIQVPISLVMILVASFLGTLGLAKRDIN